MSDSNPGKGRGRQQRGNENQKRGGGPKKHRKETRWDVKLSDNVAYPDKHQEVDCSVGQLSISDHTNQSEAKKGLNPNAKSFEYQGNTGVASENSNNFYTSTPEGKPTPTPTGRLDNFPGKSNSGRVTKSWASVANSKSSLHEQKEFPSIENKQMSERNAQYSDNQNNLNKPESASCTAGNYHANIVDLSSSRGSTDSLNTSLSVNQPDQGKPLSFANVTNSKPCNVDDRKLHQSRQNAQVESKCFVNKRNFKQPSSLQDDVPNSKLFAAEGKQYRQSADNSHTSFSDKKPKSTKNSHKGKWNSRNKPDSMDNEKLEIQMPQKDEINTRMGKNSDEVAENWDDPEKMLEDSSASENWFSTENSFENSACDVQNLNESGNYLDSKETLEDSDVKDSGELEKCWSDDVNNYKKKTARRDESPLAPDDGGPRYWRRDRKSGSIDPYPSQRKSEGNSRNVTRQRFDTKKKDDFFDDYDCNYRKANLEFKRVIEVDGDLFSAGEEYALAHCVAEDMNMGSGIALTFRKLFGAGADLLDQKEKQGGLAHLNHKGRYVYYLVTKRESSKKPTLLTMFKSVNRLKEHMVKNGVEKVAIPRLGCGLDRLEWNEVKNMLEYVFKDTEIEIKVFNFQQAYAQMEAKSSDHSFRKCRITTLTTTIKDYNQKYTMVLYLGTEQGDITPEIQAIDERFNFLADYKNKDKTMGKYIYSYRNNTEYCLIGIIARKRQRDPFDFKLFGQAVHDLHKENNKAEKFNEKYYNAVIHKYTDPDDDIFMSKITNILRNTFHKVEINVLPL